MDTLKFFPHNYQMLQLSSTNRLLMAAKDTTDAFRNLHPDVPLASVGDDTIAALTDLAAIFKLKLHQDLSPVTQASPSKVVPRPSPVPSAPQILNSPMSIRRQTISQTVKLPQPQLRTRTYTQAGQSTLRATQVRAALSHAYAVTYQNRITDNP
jgi:hypothetical protein